MGEPRKRRAKCLAGRRHSVGARGGQQGHPRDRVSNLGAEE